MEFHVSREVRNRTGVDDLLFNYAGNVVFGNLAASREFVKKFNESRAATEETAPVLHAGAMFAMGLIDELNHAMIARYRETLDPEVLPQALKWFQAKGNQEQVDKLLLEFTNEFPTVSVYRGKQTPAEWLAAKTPAELADSTRDMPNREIAVEELLMLWLANINPAFKIFKELFDDRPLAEKTIYPVVTSGFPEYFATRPPVGAMTLLDVLKAPMLASPDSLSGQLAYMRDHWVEYLGEKFAETLKKAVVAAGVVQEEEIAVWLMFHPSEGGKHRHGDGKWEAAGFEGDEFVGFDNLSFDAPQQPQPLNEYEAFSPDQAWMPTVVMIAKSTYVWLEQLSKKYQRHIHRLDQIPGEEFGVLASRGINALWLIGLWERSTASQTIKRMMGQHDAVASAYSLKDYQIAHDLGGTWAYEQLRNTAGRYGIRLASDMVPNHMGIDSNWVLDHPEWFLSRSESPFPVYTFEGPDLSTDSRYEIKIEDHYFNQTDAAVVFRLRERSNGHTQFVYHGNDGTTFAWNDTAQLDYSKAFVREQVIQTILQVARLFPIIRFDAAMTLAKKHVQRLWFPLPGVGGSIPSRAESAISQEEFDAMMPHEFWREVVDRVAVEVPGTLLLAEAFWLLEGYFVRTLGMHRVYNSAFMNMLRDEENAKYRSYLKKTIEFDPDILKRYVNFMSNPDEKTAIAQFGTGDKYFGTCTMLATIPGLPMIGHGQVEAFTEKYGMEYKTARFEEWPNEDLVARHMREIAPLLKNRQLFAESHNFVMYDFWAGENNVNENVFVYSNRVDHSGSGYGGSGKERALIFYNNAYQSTHGTIHVSVASMDKGSGELRQRTLTDALHLPSDPNLYLAWRDSASHLEYLRRSSDFDHHGFSLELRGYQYAVLLDWRELYATAAQPWDQLAGVLGGGGVHSLDEALTKLRLRPLHEALRHAISPETLRGVAASCASAPPAEMPPAVEPVASEGPAAVIHAIFAEERKVVPQPVAVATPSGAMLDGFFGHAWLFFERALRADQSSGSPVMSRGPVADAKFRRLVRAAACLPAAESEFSMPWPESARKVIPNRLDQIAHEGSGQAWAPVLAWLMIDSMAATPANTTALFDQLHLRSALGEIFSSVGIEDGNVWRVAARIRVLLANPSVTTAAQLAESGLWDDAEFRWLTALSESGGVTYLNKECFEEMVWWLQLPRILAGDDAAEIQALAEEAGEAAKAAGYDVAKLRELLLPDPKAVARVPAKPLTKEAEPITLAEVRAENGTSALEDAVVEDEETVKS
jgi:hypothetical protein